MGSYLDKLMVLLHRSLGVSPQNNPEAIEWPTSDLKKYSEPRSGGIQ
jgi:hypothetical protein